jgi:hypothetical protein
MTQATLNFDAPRAAQIAAVAAKAESLGFDSTAAGAFILEYLKAGPAFGPDIVDAACLAGFEPHDRRAFGGVFQGLAHTGKIVRDGYATRSNGSPGLRWRLA